jgi:hypothetical protein
VECVPLAEPLAGVTARRRCPRQLHLLTSSACWRCLPGRRPAPGDAAQPGPQPATEARGHALSHLPQPPFVHLASWAVGLLLLVGWLTPVTVAAQPLSSVWDDWPVPSSPCPTRPCDHRADPDPEGAAHTRLQGVLPFQGSINLRERNVLTLTSTRPRDWAAIPSSAAPSTMSTPPAAGCPASATRRTAIPPTSRPSIRRLYSTASGSLWPTYKWRTRGWRARAVHGGRSSGS